MKNPTPKSKTLTLDVKKWRCGGNAQDDDTRLGRGTTCLSNNDGFMCCLGQFALQLGAQPKEILEKYYPYHIKTDYPLINKKVHGQYVDTDFSRIAAAINDDEFTSVKVKIKRLRILCKEHGYKLKVINNKP